MLELLAILAIAAIWLAIPIAVIVVIMRRARATAAALPSELLLVADHVPALDVLRSRLAGGEIDEAEFHRLPSVLHGG